MMSSPLIVLLKLSLITLYVKSYSKQLFAKVESETQSVVALANITDGLYALVAAHSSHGLQHRQQLRSLEEQAYAVGVALSIAVDGEQQALE